MTAVKKKKKKSVFVCYVCVCLNAYPHRGQAPGRGDKLIRSRMSRARTDEKDGGPAAEVCIYRMTQQLLSPVFSLFL